MNVKFNYSNFEMPEIVSENSTIKKIISFSQLVVGWDFGVGHPIKKEVIDEAIYICSIGDFYHFKSNALPDSDGSIILNLFKEDTFLLITIKENITFDLVHEKGIGTEYEILNEKENVSMVEIETTLKEINRKWFSLGLYTLINTIQPGNDLEAIVSKIQVGGPSLEFQYLKKNAQNQPVDQYVHILQPIIDPRFQTQSYSLELA